MSADRGATRQRGTAARAGSWLGSLAGRLRRAWRVLPYERRLAACAAAGLFLTLFLPWYQETVIASGRTTRLQSLTASLTGWGAFSFVEAAVLLVAVGVLVLLVQRAEGRAFHLPGGDGWVITAAGAWTCVLIVWRIFDKQGAGSHGQYATTSGIEWGIFVALLVAALLTYAGSRIRAAHRPEPALPGEEDAPDFGFGVRASRSRSGSGSASAPRSAARETAPVPPRRTPARPPQPGERPVGWLTAPPQRPSGRESAPPRPSGTPRPAPDATPQWDGAPREWPLRRAKPSYPPSDPPPNVPRPVRAADPGESEAPTRRSRPSGSDDGDEQLTMPLDRDE